MNRYEQLKEEEQQGSTLAASIRSRSNSASGNRRSVRPDPPERKRNVALPPAIQTASSAPMTGYSKRQQRLNVIENDLDDEIPSQQSMPEPVAATPIKRPGSAVVVTPRPQRSRSSDMVTALPPALQQQQQQLRRGPAFNGNSMQTAATNTTNLSSSSRKQGDLIVLTGSATALSKSRSYDSAKSSRSSSTNNSSMRAAPSLRKSRSVEEPTIEQRQSYGQSKQRTVVAGVAVVTPEKQQAPEPSPERTPEQPIELSRSSSNNKSSTRVSSKVGAAAAVMGAGAASAAVVATTRGRSSSRREDPSASFRDEEVTSTPPYLMSKKPIMSSPSSDSLTQNSTFDSALNSPSTFDSAASSPSSFSRALASDDDVEMGKKNNKSRDLGMNQVNHNFNAAPKSTGKKIMGMSRLALGALSITAAGAAAVGVYTGVKLPPLNTQVAELEAQVKRLSTQVDRLQVENQRFNASNNMLNASIVFFQEQNIQLNATSIRLRETAIDLDVEIGELQALSVQLANVTEVFSQENQALNATNQALNEDVQTLYAHVNALNNNNLELNATVNDLNEQITNLGTENDQLNATSADLQDIWNRTQQVSNGLDQNLQNLNTTITYLDQNFNGTQLQIRQQITELSDQIMKSRWYGIEQKNLLFLKTFRNWDCDMASKYRTQFTFSKRIIANSTLVNMLTDMNSATGLVTNLCLNNTNYKAYLDYWHDITTPKMTTQQFIDGTNEYSQAALTYMFPNDPTTDGGLTYDQWELANYSCTNIPPYEWTL